MDGMEEIVALNAEARRRGTSYGKLVALLSLEERQAVIHKAERARKKRGDARKRRKKEKPPEA